MSTSKIKRQRKSSRDRNDHARWGWSPSVLAGHNSLDVIPGASDIITAPVAKGIKFVKNMVVAPFSLIKKGSRGA